MLRPQSNRFLGSTRAERRRNLRREQVRAVGNVVEGASGIVFTMAALLGGLILLWGLPFAYAISSFLVLALPLRWAAGRAPFTLLGGVELAISLLIAALGLIRASQDAEPIAPVRPVFAKAMLGLCWLAAGVLAATDVWG